MTEKLELGFCDVCRRSSSRLERDLWEVLATFNGEHIEGPKGRRFVFAETVHQGCPSHPPVVVCYNLDGSIAVSAPIGFEHKRDLPSLLVPSNPGPRVMAPYTVPWSAQSR